jgi:hypothetical protein
MLEKHDEEDNYFWTPLSHCSDCYELENQISIPAKNTDFLPSVQRLNLTQTLCNWYWRIVSWFKCRDVKLNVGFCLEMTLRMCGVVPPINVYVFVSWCLIKHGGKVNSKRDGKKDEPE